MIVYNTFLFAFSLASITQCIHGFEDLIKVDPKPTPSYDWDYLCYSQRWPITACTDWEEAKPDHTCNLPTDKSQWTVHGIWPSRIGGDSPLFCPSAVHFDPNQLTPIMDDLNSHWTNVEANTKSNSFWKHEWAKHGTCSVTQPELNSVFNFFSQGLKWNKQYNIAHILEQSKIIPGVNGYTIRQIYDAVKASTKTEPMIRCIVDRHTKETMISEIRICFNKSMELMDCDHTNPVHNKVNEGIITNCGLKKPVMYYATVPATEVAYEMDYIDESCKQHIEEQLYYIGLYKFLKFLIWFTT